MPSRVGRQSVHGTGIHKKIGFVGVVGPIEGFESYRYVNESHRLRVWTKKARSTCVLRASVSFGN